MIEVKHLTKRYGTHLAVSDLSFSIERGHVYGFLGPNGAGKSTTMNIITGCLGATEGDVFIDGHNIFEEPTIAKSKIGYLPEIPPLYLDMTPEEHLKFVLAAKKVPRKLWREQMEYAIEKTKLEPVCGRLVRNLSKGYKQRVGFAQALIGNPEVIILDEPTVGLDPAQIIEVRSLIRELGEKHTVILSSHILSEVNAICDSILIISKGKLVANDTPGNLTRRLSGTSMLSIQVRADEDAVRALLSENTDAESITYRHGEESGVTGFTLSAVGDPREKLFYLFANAQMPILEMKREQASLEDVFLELTSSDATAGAETAAEEVAEKEGNEA